MPRVATKLSPRKDGSWYARKRIPTDVRDEYAKLYGCRWEARWTCEAVSVGLARQKHREWLTEIEGRIDGLRSDRKGTGRLLTPKEARRLAGEWYHWFTAKHEAQARSVAHWDTSEEVLLSELHGVVLGQTANGLDAPRSLDLARELDDRPEVRQELRPIAPNHGETAQFLHSKKLRLDQASRDMFLDYVVRDLFAAVRLLKSRAQGDYSEDTWPQEFPKFDHAGDPGLTAWMLFERWIDKAKPKDATVDRWRSVFLSLKEHFGNRSATSLTPEEAHDWAQGLVTTERTARTVKDVWVVAAKRVFSFAVDNRLLASNPFAKIKITVPRQSRTRDGKEFTPGEARTILSASLAITGRTKGAAAKRWLPWLCAYTGARSGEIAQLRGSDVIEQDGIHAIKITPDAGTVKTGRARTVPLHPHLIEQGLMDFAKASGKGPLFYNEPKGKPAKADATNPAKPRYVKVREHIGTWVRRLGVTDAEVQPNQAWRHTFKQVGHRAGISERLLDEIVGHAPATVGKGYGIPTLQDKADALGRFPRYDLTLQTEGRGGATMNQSDQGNTQVNA
jgi:integrase